MFIVAKRLWVKYYETGSTVGDNIDRKSTVVVFVAALILFATSVAAVAFVKSDDKGYVTVSIKGTDNVPMKDTIGKPIAQQLNNTEQSALKSLNLEWYFQYTEAPLGVIQVDNMPSGTVITQVLLDAIKNTIHGFVIDEVASKIRVGVSTFDVISTLILKSAP